MTDQPSAPSAVQIAAEMLLNRLHEGEYAIVFSGRWEQARDEIASALDAYHRARLTSLVTADVRERAQSVLYHGHTGDLAEYVEHLLVAERVAVVEMCAQIIEAQDGMHGWKRRILSAFRALSKPPGDQG